jgi:hypothetical protein
VTNFVEQCRQELKRLRVPDPVANEMAADLAADLAEAEAEGVSPEEVLGSSAFDPRLFAAAWAAERGVIPSTPPQERTSQSRRPIVLASTAALLASGLITAAVIILTSRSPIAIAWHASAAPLPRPVPLGQVQPPPFVRASNAQALGWTLLLIAAPAIILTAWLWATRIRPRRAAMPA